MRRVTDKRTVWYLNTSEPGPVANAVVILTAGSLGMLSAYLSRKHLWDTCHELCLERAFGPFHGEI